MRQNTKLEIFGAEMFAEIVLRDAANNGQFMSRVSRLTHWGNDEDVIDLVLFVRSSKEVEFVIRCNHTGHIIINGAIIRNGETDLWSTHT